MAATELDQRAATVPQQRPDAREVGGGLLRPPARRSPAAAAGPCPIHGHRGGPPGRLCDHPELSRDRPGGVAPVRGDRGRRGAPRRARVGDRRLAHGTARRGRARGWPWMVVLYH